MNYLHTCKPPVLHRDLKPANLLLDFSDTLKVRVRVRVRIRARVRARVRVRVRVRVGPQAS